MKKLIQKLKRFLYVWDGFWSVPLSAIFFILAGIGIQWFFTPKDGQGGPGFYDPSFIQVAIYTAFILVLINFVAFLGLFFNFKTIFGYLVGKQLEDGSVNHPFKSEFETLTTWQKAKLSLGVYFSFCVLFVVVFKILV